MIAALAIVVFGLALGALAFPLVRRPRVAPVDSTELSPGSDLLDERDAVLNALRELEFDHATGKLADDDYQVLRVRYERRAVALLKATDWADPAAPSSARGSSTSTLVPPVPGDVPPPRLAPVLEPGAPALAARTTGPAGRPVVHRNGKDHSLSRPALGIVSPRAGAGASPRRARQTALLTAGLAMVFLLGVGAVYWTTNRAQGDQRALATLDGIGPRALALAPGGRAFLAAAGGLWTSGDAGTAWQALGGLDSPLRAVAVSPARPTRVYAVGPGLLARSDDGGRGWVQRRAELGEQLPLPSGGTETSRGPADLRALAVDPAAPDRLWVLVEGVGLYRSDDAGESWTLRAQTLPANATALVAVSEPAPDGRAPWLYLASATEGVVVSGDEGAGWAPASGVLNGALPTRRVTSLAFDASGDETATTPDGRTLRGALYAGTDQGVFKTLDRGQTWARLPLAVPVAAVGAGESGWILAVDREGHVYRSRNRGVTWDGS